MNREEFLQKLREALANDLDERTVQENVNYYNNYISDEVRTGKSEQEVIDMLGDPWMLARTIIDAPGGNSGGSYTYEPENESQKQRQNTNRNYSFGMGSWWQIVLLVLGIIGVVVLIFAIIGGLISLFLPILVPVLIIFLVLRLLGGGGRR